MAFPSCFFPYSFSLSSSLASEPRLAFQCKKGHSDVKRGRLFIQRSWSVATTDYLKQDQTRLNKLKQVQNQRPKTKNKNVINFDITTPLPLLLTLPILSSNMWILQLTTIVLIRKEKKKIFLLPTIKKVMSTSWRNKISLKCHLYDIWLIFECQNSGLNSRISVP